MQNDFVDNKKKYLIIENQKENLMQNKTVQSFNNAEELKKNFFDENNQISNNYSNKSMIFINQNMNNILSNSNISEENIKGIIEENSNLFLEINQLNKEIELYSNRLDELNSEYNKIKQDYRDHLLKEVSSENIQIEKELGDKFNKLEEEKYQIKLNHLLNINKELKEKNQKALKHNEQMKILYKKYSGKNWQKNIEKNQNIFK